MAAEVNGGVVSSPGHLDRGRSPFPFPSNGLGTRLVVMMMADLYIVDDSFTCCVVQIESVVKTTGRKTYDLLIQQRLEDAIAEIKVYHQRRMDIRDLRLL